MPPSTLRLLIAAFACCGLMAACDTPPPRPTYPDIRFTNEQPFRLDVAAIDVKTEFQPSFQAPHVEHLFPVPPMRAVESWAHDRLQAAGSHGRARFTIHDAGVVEVELQKKTEGLRAALTTEPAQRYDATVAVTLEILNDRGFADRTINVTASSSRGVLEGITPNEREQTWYDMTRQLLADVDRRLDTEIRANLGTYLQ